MDTSDFDFQPCLAGERVVLRPLTADDFDALYAVASDPAVWEQHPDRARHLRDVFATNFFAGALASGSAFVVHDAVTNAVIGSSRYYDWQPSSREVAIGYTFLARSHWGGPTNRELKVLMLRHAFRFADVVRFHIGAQNFRSRKAIEKLGARYTHDELRRTGNADVVHACYRIDKPGPGLGLAAMNTSALQLAMDELFSGDAVAAETLLLALACSGDGHAAHNLGTLYATGWDGVAADPAKSQEWYQRALDSGFEATVASDPTWFKRER